MHCGSNKTPQWRAGPVGAKTLCNACGVRYKNGRLQPICAFPPFGPLTGGEGDAQQHSRGSMPSTMLSPAKRAACSTDVSDEEQEDYRYPSMQHTGGALLAPVMTGTVPKRPRGSGGHPAAPAFGLALTT